MLSALQKDLFMTTKSSPHRFSTRAIHEGQEPDPQLEPLPFRFIPLRPTCSRELASTRVTNTLESPIPPAPISKKISPRSKAVPPRAFSPAAWQPSTRSPRCTSPAITSSAATICTGGVPRLFNQVWWTSACEFAYVDTSDAKNVERAIKKNTRMVYIETPTNPLMSLTDIAAVSRICRRRKVELVVDNTFMSPYFQQPIALGADMVVHSTTKFLNGHSDGLGGVVVCAKPEHAEKLAFLQKAAGASCPRSNAG